MMMMMMQKMSALQTEHALGKDQVQAEQHHEYEVPSHPPRDLLRVGGLQQSVVRNLRHTWRHRMLGAGMTTLERIFQLNAYKVCLPPAWHSVLNRLGSQHLSVTLAFSHWHRYLNLARNRVRHEIEMKDATASVLSTPKLILSRSAVRSTSCNDDEARV